MEVVLSQTNNHLFEKDCQDLFRKQDSCDGISSCRLAAVSLQFLIKPFHTSYISIRDEDKRLKYRELGLFQQSKDCKQNVDLKEKEGC